jgi:hypothetical protein
MKSPRGWTDGSDAVRRPFVALLSNLLLDELDRVLEAQVHDSTTWPRLNETYSWDQVSTTLPLFPLSMASKPF